MLEGARGQASRTRLDRFWRAGEGCPGKSKAEGSKGAKEAKLRLQLKSQKVVAIVGSRRLSLLPLTSPHARLAAIGLDVGGGCPHSAAAPTRHQGTHSLRQAGAPSLPAPLCARA